MILRRFMKHVTDQNWFAVGLDVIVVIVGIFLGLQVQAAYQDRTERVQEDRYLERIHSEVSGMVLSAENNFRSRDQLRLAMLEAQKIINMADANTELTDLQCNGIYQSHIYFNANASLPAITEIISSGQLSVIRNENIRILISKYILFLERWDALIGNLAPSGIHLAIMYPEIIRLDNSVGSTLAGDFQLERYCNISLMMQNNSFNNAFIGNQGRYNAYVINLLMQLNLLKEMHQELDQVLAINH